MTENITAIIAQKLTDIGQKGAFVTKTHSIDLEGNEANRLHVSLPAQNVYYLLIGVETLPFIMEISAHNFLYRRKKTNVRYSSIWEFPLLSGQVSLYFENQTGANYTLNYIEVTLIPSPNSMTNEK